MNQIAIGGYATPGEWLVLHGEAHPGTLFTPERRRRHPQNVLFFRLIYHMFPAPGV